MTTTVPSPVLPGQQMCACHAAGRTNAACNVPQCQNCNMQFPPSAPSQRANPLHGLTLETIVTALVTHYGWAGLAERVPVRCFTHEPSVPSSLKFLRKTPWAREKTEGLYLFMLRELRRGKSGAADGADDTI